MTEEIDRDEEEFTAYMTKMGQPSQAGKYKIPQPQKL
jgi:hypothetical protein